MSAASGGEREGRKWAGGTPDPVRGASPPAPPLDEWMSELLRFWMSAASDGEREEEKVSGDTPDPGRGALPPAPPLDACRLRRRAGREEVGWGHPRPRQEDCVPLHSLLNS